MAGLLKRYYTRLIPFGSDKVPRGKMAGLPEPMAAGEMVLPPATLARALFSKNSQKMTGHQERENRSAYIYFLSEKYIKNLYVAPLHELVCSGAKIVRKVRKTIDKITKV